MKSSILFPLLLTVANSFVIAPSLSKYTTSTVGQGTGATTHQASRYIPSSSPLPTTRRLSNKILVTSMTSSSDACSSSDSSSLKDLKVAIVGGGPSGLLLAYALLQRGASSVEVYESRKDPRDFSDLEGRAYALGIGIRGRTAIRSAGAGSKPNTEQNNDNDDELWKAVKERGYESERFTLYLRTLPIKLRDGSSRSHGTESGTSEPSVLMYQSDLCAALLDQLERLDTSTSNNKFNEKRLSVNFGQKINSCDLERKTITLENDAVTGPFDIIVGCDGVNSVVRKAMAETSSVFSFEKNSLPGEFKVCRLPEAPPKLDPTTVALIVPKSGSTTAFVEPTANGSCILFAGKGGTDDVVLYPPSSNLTETVVALEERFPILEGSDFEEMARQLSKQKPGAASSIQCNTYHYGAVAVLCGDAAHATGGVSGQGVNSALVDSQVLAECLAQHFDPTLDRRQASLAQALLTYSQKQVPEGKALYDLSFGPNPQGIFLKAKFLARNAIDTLFQGRFGIGQPPLQTLLTTSLDSFAQVRRDRDQFYDETFPSKAVFDEVLASMHEETQATASKNTARI